MPRLFTGLEIPQMQRMQLSLLQSGLQNVRWIEPSDMHITLRFIGDVSPSFAGEIAESLSHKIWRAPQVTLGELAAFGSKKPKSVHASVLPSRELSDLAAGHERLMQQLGLEPDSRKFTPHVTLGRCRQVAIPNWRNGWPIRGASPARPSHQPGSSSIQRARAQAEVPMSSKQAGR